MAAVLGLDIGSSSVIAGLLDGRRVLAESPRAFFRTRHEGAQAEVDPEVLLAAVATAIRGLGSRARTVDAIALATMCPAWVALDRDGKALTPIVTHQDRRSVAEARVLEERIGAGRHLALCGCRPFPGGISSTTWAWFRKHQPGALRRADLVGHLNTFLHRRLTGARVTEADFKGQPTLIYFGFTYCPDVCPMTLQTVAAAYRKLPEGTERPQTLLISVDPGRDTPEALATYVANKAFPEGLQGLTGTEAEIRAAADAFKADYSRVEQPGSLAEYTMDHTSLLYLMDEEWKLKTLYSSRGKKVDHDVHTCREIDMETPLPPRKDASLAPGGGMH
jgi:protein SCO1/2